MTSNGYEENFDDVFIEVLRCKSELGCKNITIVEEQDRLLVQLPNNISLEIRDETGFFCQYIMLEGEKVRGYISSSVAVASFVNMICYVYKIANSKRAKRLASYNLPKQVRREQRRRLRKELAAD